MPSRRTLLLVVLAATVVQAVAFRAAADDGPTPTPAETPRPAPSTRIGDFLKRPEVRLFGEPLRERAALERLYASREGRPVWGNVPRAARDLLVAVRASASHGMPPAHYHEAALARLAAQTLPHEDAAEAELLLSDAFLSLARAFTRGVIDPRAFDADYDRGEPLPDPLDLLARVVDLGEEPAAVLAQAAPHHMEYVHLRRALARLHDEMARDDVSPEPDPARVERAAGRATIDRIRVNLERWRWQPRDLGRRAVRVDIPRFELSLLEDGGAVRSMRVVVGRRDWPTPVVHSAITQLVLNPAWDVPHSIFVKEMLPRARLDPAYFDANGLEIRVRDASGWQVVAARSIDWPTLEPDREAIRVRQPPGPANPLGRIKLPFPGPYDVHLHGTPGRASFEQPRRTLSHGCVRVEDEIALALFALAPDPGWSRERLEAALRTAREQRIALPSPLPVHLFYFTIEADAAGGVTIPGDPYGWDALVLAALDETATRP